MKKVRDKGTFLEDIQSPIALLREQETYSNNFLGRGDGDNDFDDSLRAFGQTFNNSVLSNLNNVDSTWASRLVSQKMRRLSVVNKLLKDSEQDEWQIL